MKDEEKDWSDEKQGGLEAAAEPLRKAMDLLTEELIEINQRLKRIEQALAIPEET